MLGPKIPPELKKLATQPGKVVPPTAEWKFSQHAKYRLLSYFEYNVFPGRQRARRNKRYVSMRRDFTDWLTPKNLDGLPVSKLFTHANFRRDIAEEIDRQLKRYGCGLYWDC